MNTHEKGGYRERSDADPLRLDPELQQVAAMFAQLQPRGDGLEMETVYYRAGLLSAARVWRRLVATAVVSAVLASAASVGFVLWLRPPEVPERVRLVSAPSQPIGVPDGAAPSAVPSRQALSSAHLEPEIPVPAVVPRRPPVLPAFDWPMTATLTSVPVRRYQNAVHDLESGLVMPAVDEESFRDASLPPVPVVEEPAAEPYRKQLRSLLDRQAARSSERSQSSLL